jgi:hypothetical protein
VQGPGLDSQHAKRKRKRAQTFLYDVFPTLLELPNKGRCGSEVEHLLSMPEFLSFSTGLKTKILVSIKNVTEPEW